MLTYERSKSARDNFGKFIHQYQSETKTFIKKLERILKLYRQNVSLLINQTYLNERLLHPHIYILIAPNSIFMICLRGMNEMDEKNFSYTLFIT